MTLRDNFFNSTLGITASQIFHAKEEAHNIIEFRFWVHDEILEPNEENGHFLGLSILNVMVKPSAYEVRAVIDPPVPIVWILLLMVICTLRRMIGMLEKFKP